jgi:hypothetical protein
MGPFQPDELKREEGKGLTANLAPQTSYRRKKKPTKELVDGNSLKGI